MSAKERISKLEGLLARIKGRAEAPRPISRVLEISVPASMSAEPEFISVPPPSLHVSMVTAPPGIGLSEPPQTAPPPSLETSPPPDATAATGWSEPPPETEVHTYNQEDQDAIDQMNDVEVSSEVVEVEIDIDEPSLPAESGAHAVSEHEEPAELEEVHDDRGSVTSAPPPANEVAEPEPTSSPRPITSESYEEGSAPRHTPPPESGKQVAMPSVRPEPPVRKPTAPPPSEGHTLIGGWREPGMGLPGSPGARARGEEGALPRPPVRVPPPPPPPPAPLSSSPVTPPPVQVQLASARPVQIEASVTHADLPSEVEIAAFEGNLATFNPSTFGELLDASLTI